MWLCEFLTLLSKDACKIDIFENEQEKYNGALSINVMMKVANEGYGKLAMNDKFRNEFNHKITVIYENFKPKLKSYYENQKDFSLQKVMFAL